MAGDYGTPGGAMAATLQQILARKKMESRQAMLDQQANEDRARQAKQDEIRNQMLNADLELKRLGAIDGMDLPPGTDLTDWAARHPELAQTGDKYYRFDRTKSIPTPAQPAQPTTSTGETTSKMYSIDEAGNQVPIPTDPSAVSEGTGQTVLTTPPTSPPPPTTTTQSGYFARGSKEERDKQKIQESYRGLIEKIGDFDSKTPIDKVLMVAAETGAPTNIVMQYLLPLLTAGKRGILKEATGEITPATMNGQPLTSRDDLTVINRPPAGPQPQAFSRVDENGNTVWSWVRPGEPIPADARRGNQPAPPGGGAGRSLLDQAESTQLADAKSKAATGNSLLVTQWRQRAINGINRMHARIPTKSQKVIQAARDIINTPGYDNIPTPDIIKHSIGGYGLTPEEIQDLINVLSNARSEVQAE